MKIFSLVCSLFLFHSCIAQFTQEQFQSLQVEGRWEMKTKKGVLVESWTKKNDSTLTGYSYMLAGTDSIPQEVMELSFSGNRISFTATAAGQNDNKPVSFPLVSMVEGWFHFENPQHDFPQRISYQASDKILRVVISGPSEKGRREIPFNFIRVL